MPFAPISNQVNIWHIFPSNGPSMFCHNHLKLRPYCLEETAKCIKYSVHTFYIT